MKIKTFEDAMKILIESSVIQKQATEVGNSKLFNKHYLNKKDAIKFLSETCNIDKLVPLLQHEENYVKYCAAVYLLGATEYQNLAVETLKKLKEIEGILALNAEYALMEFRGKTDN